jgi:hypothetical protein
MRIFLSELPYPDKDKSVVRDPDPLIVRSSSHVLSRSEHILGKALHPESKKAAR